MNIVIVGAGLVGSRCADLLVNHGHDVTLVGYERLPNPVHGVAVVRGWSPELARAADMVVIATASRHQAKIARSLLGTQTDVVLTADDQATVEEVWSLGRVVAAAQQRFVVGAAYSPGVSSVLVRYLALQLDEVTTIATAQFGTGGPACARQHHRAMGSSGVEIHDGKLRAARGGSGRELVWFPDPIGAVDCYRANLAEPWLLRQVFPEVPRIESRQAATRRDRLTTHLPMLRPPHAEGLLGGVWAEVRGRRNGRVEHLAMAITAPQATGAAAMAAVACEWLQQTEGDNVAPVGILSTASTAAPGHFLHQLCKNMRLWTYDGSQIVGNLAIDHVNHVARKRSARQNR